ncbi:MAG: insulinase family protein [Lachnospiraceae bacterium]|nr:insulinase family protein [Lachnospiraceae bacterium]
MNFDKLSAYELVEQHHSKDLDSEAYLLRHKKTGARVAVLENEEENKVFYIGFRTPPKDSTGVAHIVEHTVLCGSDKYPCKDPFVELCKSSLNTFLNAMTYPDKTVYPVASCNDKDFQNLMDVYLDAVFHPNIYHEEKIFMQEGWHYEMETEDSPLTYNGVVYNEMKGAFSNPEDVFAREILNSLYPDTAYAVESGGDPDVIPELTYQAFLDFHSKYYHPSNAYIYLYGNGDMAERLKWMDEEYLSKYDALKVDSYPGKQRPFDAPLYLQKEYPIAEDESEENATFLSYNMTLPENDDMEIYMAMDIIDRALCGNGGILRKTLTEKGIGTEVDACLDQCLLEPYYSVSTKNANASDEKMFVETIEEVLTNVVKEGFDKEALYAAINRNAFKLREADFGHYPKGLIYGLNALESWLYDDNKPFASLEMITVLEKLEKKVEEGYFEKLVEDLLLKNNHKTILTLVPKKGLQAKRDQALSEKLEAYKQSLTTEEKQKIIESTKALKEYQLEEDTPEQKATLPSLSREDLKREGRQLHSEEMLLDGYKAIYHEYATGGIIYVQMLFDYTDLPVQYLPYVTLLFDILGNINTTNYTYDKLNYAIGRKTGGLGFASHIIENRKTHDITLYAGTKCKCLVGQLSDAAQLMEEVVFNANLQDETRLKEIIAESRSSMEGLFMGSGHTFAYNYALSMVSKHAAYGEAKSGYGYYQFLIDLDEHFDERKEEFIKTLQLVKDFLFRKDRLLFDIGCERQQIKALTGVFATVIGRLTKDAVGLSGDTEIALTPKKKTAFTFSGQVQYVCRAGDYEKAGLSFHGSLHVLKTILGYDYLWQNVRVMGGAYGCMSRFSPTGNAYFVSYRDPHLTETNAIFEACPQYIAQMELEDEELLNYIISTIGANDTPVSVPTLIDRDRTYYLSGEGQDVIQRIRNEVLDTTLEDIHTTAKYLVAFLNNDVLVVVGGEEMIKKNADLFEEIKPLVISKK